MKSPGVLINFTEVGPSLPGSSRRHPERPNRNTAATSARNTRVLGMRLRPADVATVSCCMRHEDSHMSRRETIVRDFRVLLAGRCVVETFGDRLAVHRGYQ